MYDELIAKKGQNEVISFIHYYLENLLQQGVKTLYLFSDNCSSQNKNNAIIQYLYSVIRYKAFGLETITQGYPEPGHSFLPRDRCFGFIEQKKTKNRTSIFDTNISNNSKRNQPKQILRHQRDSKYDLKFLRVF